MAPTPSTGAAVVAVPVLLVMVIVGALGFVTMEGPASCETDAPAVRVNPDSVPNGPIAGYAHEQLVNAAAIAEAGRRLNLGARDQAIGIMTAMGESGLRVLDFGDDAGPDSRGLFQQRDNGVWGSLAERMDPSASAASFFRRLRDIPQRESLSPTLVAHRVQGNQDPYHYERWWQPANEVLRGLSGVETLIGRGLGACDDRVRIPGTVSRSGWAIPATGPITSPFGWRVDPLLGTPLLHDGLDLAGGGCGGPIWAAQDGVVTERGHDANGSGIVTIDHGSGVRTSYLHMYGSGMLVHVGDIVEAGDQIARVGSSGWSTGCHLHFAVTVDGTRVNPLPFMAAVGVHLGSNGKKDAS